ncbi:MAG: hypothetical protein ACYSUI_15860 [Planctomycetota bacterium]
MSSEPDATETSPGTTTLSEHFQCDGCGYDLYGLTVQSWQTEWGGGVRVNWQVQCPECGGIESGTHYRLHDHPGEVSMSRHTPCKACRYDLFGSISQPHGELWQNAVMVRWVTGCPECGLIQYCFDPSGARPPDYRSHRRVGKRPAAALLLAVAGSAILFAFCVSWLLPI